MRSRVCAALLVSLCSFSVAADESPQLIPMDATGLRGELRALHGSVVLLNFWATWCSPCLKEIPVLRQLETELAPRGFRLVAVSLDAAYDAEIQVAPFMLKWFPGFRSYISLENDMDSMVSSVDQAWNEVLPTSYLLNRDGTVATRIQGANTLSEFREAALLLLDSPSAAAADSKP